MFSFRFFKRLGWRPGPAVMRRRSPARYRPCLLPLEGRILLSTILVDATHSLAAAVSAANPSGGDVIQLEPGGSITTPSQTVGIPVTIQGDPQFAPFVFPSGFTLTLSAAGNTDPVTLQNLALNAAGSSDLISGATAGDLNINQVLLSVGNVNSAVSASAGGNLTVTGTIIAITGTAGGFGINSTVTGNLTVSNVSISTGGGNSDAILGTVTGNETISNVTIFASGSGDIRTSVTGNNTISNVKMVLGRGEGIQCQVNGDETISNSSLFTAGAGEGISGHVDGNLTINNNSITLGGKGSEGITADAGQGKLETVSNNAISTGGLGFAMDTGGVASDSTLLQGNDLRGNLVGIRYLGAGTYDLGGGTLGSLGGNDFRGYPTGGAGGNFAFTLLDSTATFTISARNNIWGLDSSGQVIDPRTVIQDGTHNTGSSGTGVIDVGSTQLTANEEFVQTLYRVLLGRAGTISPHEVDGWASLVPSLGLFGVANGILHDGQHEAFTHLVDGFYQEFLNRPPDPAGEQAWVRFLVQGGTAEQVITGFVASSEFAQRNLFLITSLNSDGGYVQALYSLLLDRSLAQGDLTQPEISFWVSALPGLGRAGVAQAFLGSSEFRSDAVRSFYGDPTLTPVPFLPFLPNLLHRTTAPATSEISFWVNSRLDLLTVEVGIAGSAEFFAQG